MRMIQRIEIEILGFHERASSCGPVASRHRVANGELPSNPNGVNSNCDPSLIKALTFCFDSSLVPSMFAFVYTFDVHNSGESSDGIGNFSAGWEWRKRQK